jgi:hypothetical protein
VKPIPAPSVPGKTEWQRFDNAVRQVLNMPKQTPAKPEAKPQVKPQK